MITYWQQENSKLIKRKSEQELLPNEYTWLDASSVTRDELKILEEDYGIQEDHIIDILDQDELSRIEKTDEYTLIILRLPMYSQDTDIHYFTAPLGIVLREKTIITICWTESTIVKGLSSIRTQDINLADFPAFIVQILSRADNMFLRYLKEINRRSTTIQNDLQRSIKNKELILLLNLEKSLVFFTTSLKSNQLLLTKILRTKLISLDEEDREWLEDVEIDNRQAIEMADTYSDILSGMMDAFASVISNNLNMIMRKLTVISLILMIPTLIVSFFGMNIPLPFENSGWLGITVVIAACVISSFFARIMLEHLPERKKIQKKRSSRKNRSSAQSKKISKG